MKLKYIIGLFAALMIFAACDEIEAPYQPDSSELINSISDDNKNVFILEFTGWKCGNCPDAHHIIHELTNLYPEGHIVAVGIHAGSNADPSGGGPDFRTEIGDKIEDYFSAEDYGFPIGSINLKEINGSPLVYRSIWENEVFKEAVKEKEVDIKLKAMYKEETKDITVNVEVDFLNEKYSGANLSVYLVQDSIVARQKNDELPVPLVEDYVHMHVFRESFNGMWGTPITVSSNTRTYTMNINGKTDWKPDNLKVIAFVHDYNNTKLVYQVVQTSLSR